MKTLAPAKVWTVHRATKVTIALATVISIQNFTVDAAPANTQSRVTAGDLRIQANRQVFYSTQQIGPPQTNVAKVNLEGLRTAEERDPKQSARQTIPLAIYETNGVVSRIGAKSVGAIQALSVDPTAFPSTRTDRFGSVVATWKTILPKYDAAFVKTLESASSPETQQEALLLNSAFEKRLADSALLTFKEVTTNGVRAETERRIEALRLIMESLKEEELYLKEKAVYGRKAIYPAPHYGRILSNAQSIGRIQEVDGGALVGSCVHVGKGYFLTAAHVLRPRKPLEVTFQDEGATDVSWRFVTETNFSMNTNGSPLKLDLALCRITNAPATFCDSLSAARPKPVLITGAIQALEAQTAVYVIGFPNLAGLWRAIHDDCAVIVPRWIPMEDINVNFVRLTWQDRKQSCVQASTHLENAINIYVKRFEEIYGFKLQDYPGALSSAGYNARYNGMPVFGIDSDTTEGDSGGGVFDKKSGDLVGIFCGGSTNETAMAEATVDQFEYVLPIESFWATIAARIPQQ